ncbi:MAG: CapA family protein, partial [Sciscionella sp.]
MRWRATCACVVLAIALVLVACTGPRQVRPSAAPPVSSSRHAPAGFTVVASGDILVHPAVTAQAEADGGGRRDYDRILAGVAPVVSSADLAICHLETPIAPAGGPFHGYPTFSVPPEIATAIAHTGYDTCSTASNHTLDEGAAGVRRTLDALDRAGVAHTGSARSAAEAARPLILRANGVKVAQLSYTFGFNGIALPPGKPWLANEIDPVRIIHAARRARAAGAQVVIVSMHWGTEDQHKVTAQQRRLAHRLLADGSIDLIVGCHAHVVQPFARIDGKWVAYGMGNLVARHDEPLGSTEEG